MNRVGGVVGFVEFLALLGVIHANAENLARLLDHRQEDNLIFGIVGRGALESADLRQAVGGQQALDAVETVAQALAEIDDAGVGMNPETLVAVRGAETD